MDGSRFVSSHILIVPEDPTYNGAILKPLIERMASACGKGNARVTVLTNPSLKGIDQLRIKIGEIASRYTHMDAVICVVDANGNDRSGMFRAMRERASALGDRILFCAVVQEVETWLLAGHAEKLPQPWSGIRANTSVKEEVFQPFLEQHGHHKRPSSGRDMLMKEALRQYDGILTKCPALRQLQIELCTILLSADSGSGIPR